MLINIYSIENVGLISTPFSIVNVIQIGLILLLFIILLFLLKYIRSINLEKRLSKYTVNSNKMEFISLFDNLSIKYNNFIDKLSKLLNKSEIIKKRCNKYEKYKIAFTPKSNNIDFISRKIVVGFVYIVFAIIINSINGKLLSFMGMIIPFILGYYTLDFIYVYKYSIYKKRLENDLYEAIALMNNAFKAGMSIMQAINLVSKELEGPISNEFKKIYMEISLGLDIEVSFKRFAERIKIDEAIYLSSSMAVLNKTGGNIIKVFNSIEKTIFSKKKLKQELKALTASSKLIMYVLIFVPIVFVLFINIINNGYFTPLFNNPIGILLLIFMLIIYISYIIVVRKVMNVRGVK